MDSFKIENFSYKKPIIIKVTNTSNSTKQKVKLLHPSATSDNNYGNSNTLTIESGVPDVDYKDYLSFLNGKNIRIKQVLIQAQVNSSSIINVITVHTENLHNQTYSGLRLVPIINPYQNQTSCVLINKEFTLNNIDGYSELSLTVNENASFIMYLYMDEELESNPEFKPSTPNA